MDVGEVRTEGFHITGYSTQPHLPYRRIASRGRHDTVMDAAPGSNQQFWIPDLISSEAMPTHHCMMYYGPWTVLNCSFRLPASLASVHSGTISLAFLGPIAGMQGFGPSSSHWPVHAPHFCSPTSWFRLQPVILSTTTSDRTCFVVQNIRTAPPVRFHRGTLDLANPWGGGPTGRRCLVSTYLSGLSTTRQALAGHGS